MQRDSFIFYRSFFEAAEPLPSKEKLALFEAITNYALNGSLPDLPPIAKAMFTLIKPQLDANQKKYQNGTKGGRPKTKEEPNDNLDVTKGKANENVNDNANENKNVNKKGNEVSSLIFKENLSKGIKARIKAGEYVSKEDKKLVDEFEAEIKSKIKAGTI